jgi:hypothetical protein
MEPVRGRMTGPRPKPDRNVPGGGQWVDTGDTGLPTGTGISSHFVHWRLPPDSDEIYRVSSDYYQRFFLIKASRANLTGSASYNPSEGQTFLAKRQAHTKLSSALT